MVAVPAVPVVTVPVAESALGLNEILVGLWLLASLILVVRWAVAALRLGRLSNSWPAETVDGVHVSLTVPAVPVVTVPVARSALTPIPT